MGEMNRLRRFDYVFFFAVVIVIISCVSTELATTVQNVLTAIKLGAILVIIVSGAYNLCIGK